MRDVLGTIGKATARRVAALKKRWPVAALKARPLYKRRPLDFVAALRGPGPRLIAEIKFASPSKGRLARGSAGRAAQIAGGYLAGGAAALSILTEPEFFEGSPAYLEAVRRRFPEAPLLMKDFLVDPWQCEWARACGADAALLIAALLGPKLKTMLAACKKAGVAALVEVHTAAELAEALKAKAALIGVNSRDLRTLQTDLDVARALARKDRRLTMVAESGITSRAEIAELHGLGYRAFLVGTHFMTKADPGKALRGLA